MILNHYIPEFFEYRELVPPEHYKKFGDRSLIVFDPYILLNIDVIRAFLDCPVHINTWPWEVNGYRFRGFRPSDCKIGAPTSMHRMGKAIDFHIDGESPDELRKRLLDNQHKQVTFKNERMNQEFSVKLLEFVTRMEDQVNWIHIDRANHIKVNGKVTLFNP